MKIRFSLRHAGALAAVVALAVPATITARTLASGDLDTSFDSDGVVIANFTANDDTAQAIAVQSDGKLVVAGHARLLNRRELAVARFNSDGSIDTSFGTGGIATTSLEGAQTGYGVVIQSDGKIVVAGDSARLAVVARFNSDGTLDTSFGTGGDGVTAFLEGGTSRAYDIALDSSGKIILGGRSLGGGGLKFFAARLNTDGTLDSTFSVDGKFSVGVGRNPNNAFAVAVDSSDRVILAGRSTQTTGVQQMDFAVVRLTTGGDLDTSFGGDGTVHVPISPNRTDVAADVVLQGDGKIVVVGRTFSASERWNFAAARLNTDGTLDSSFGSSGIVSFPIGALRATDIAHGAALDSSGKIILAGYTGPNGRRDFAVARLNTNGALDTSFSSDGIATFHLADRDDEANAVLVQSDGNVVLAGYAKPVRRQDIALVRLEG